MDALQDTIALKEPLLNYHAYLEHISHTREEAISLIALLHPLDFGVAQHQLIS